MNDFLSGLQRNIASYFAPLEGAVGDAAGAITKLFPQQESVPVSPLPKQESPGGYNSAVQPGLNAYYQRELPQSPQTVPNTRSQPSQAVQYPDWLANAPQQRANVIHQLTPDTTISHSALEKIIQAGLSRFSNPPPPIATLSGSLADAGSHLPDPYLPAILALMETGGGSKARTPNNLYNLGPDFAYPSPDVSIVGGGPNQQRGLLGVLTSGLYDNYLKSGNLSDFFNKFTPPGAQYGNPTLPELISRYNNLRSLFVPGNQVAQSVE